MKKIIVTTSWDDSCSENIRLIQLLNKYGLKATFYLNKKKSYFSEIKEISKFQEVGAHSLTHFDFKKLSLKEVREEILGSKKWLESIIKKPVKILAYPFGSYNNEIKKIVSQAGFIGARTTEGFCFKKSNDFFQLETSLQVYPFPLRKKDKNHYHLSRFIFQPFFRNFLRILKLGLPLSSFYSWTNLAKNTFDYALKKGDIYHLWGHGWEIEKYDLWSELEEIFKYISNHNEVSYQTNSQTLENYENINSSR